MLEYELMNLFDILSKEQKNILTEMNKKPDKEILKNLDKKLEAFTTFNMALMKLRRILNSIE